MIIFVALLTAIVLWTYFFPSLEEYQYHALYSPKDHFEDFYKSLWFPTSGLGIFIPFTFFLSLSRSLPPFLFCNIQPIPSSIRSAYFPTKLPHLWDFIESLCLNDISNMLCLYEQPHNAVSSFLSISAYTS